MTIGDTVFVRWYGKIVEGMIVENNEVTPALASMVVVRIHIQGVRASALFTPDHVYPSAELAGMKEHIKVVPTSEAKTDSNESEFWRKLQEFKLANWDSEHNHIKLSALNEFYELWKACSKPILFIPKVKVSDAEINKLAEAYANFDGKIYKPVYRYGTENKIIEYHPEADAYDGGPKPENYQQATDVVQQRMQVSDEKMAEIESQRQKALTPAEPKPRKKVNVSQLALWD